MYGSRSNFEDIGNVVLVFALDEVLSPSSGRESQQCDAEARYSGRDGHVDVRWRLAHHGVVEAVAQRGRQGPDFALGATAELRVHFVRVELFSGHPVVVGDENVLILGTQLGAHLVPHFVHFPETIHQRIHFHGHPIII